MADGISLSQTAAAAIGGAAALVARTLWGANEQAHIRELAAKDAIITVLTADVNRYRDERDALGKKYDKEAADHVTTKEQFAGYVAKTGDYADVPTAVHHLAAIGDPKMPTPKGPGRY